MLVAGVIALNRGDAALPAMLRTAYLSLRTFYSATSVEAVNFPATRRAPVLSGAVRFPVLVKTGASKPHLDHHRREGV